MAIGSDYLADPEVVIPIERNAMEKTTLKALTDYFNEGDGKRPLKDWSDEIKALSPAEKLELATGVCAVTGWTLKAA